MKHLHVIRHRPELSTLVLAQSPQLGNGVGDSIDHFASTPNIKTYDVEAATRDDVSRHFSDANIDRLEALLLYNKSHLIDAYLASTDVTKLENSSPALIEFCQSYMTYKQNIDFLLEAICNGDMRVVIELIDYRRCVLARHPSMQFSVVHLAVIHNRPDILALLLNHRAPINATDIEGRTPLHYAAALAGNLSAADRRCHDLLIDHQADEELADLEGYMPLDFFRMPKLINVQQLRAFNQYPLRKGDAVDKMICRRDTTGLQQLVLDGDYERVNIAGRIFPATSRDMSASLANLQTRIAAIHEAVRENDFHALKQLMDSERLAVGRDEHGRTPLHLAVLYSRERIVHYLLLLFQKCVDYVDKNNRTPLYYALNLPRTEKMRLIIRLMRRAGADILLTGLASEDTILSEYVDSNGVFIANASDTILQKQDYPRSHQPVATGIVQPTMDLFHDTPEKRNGSWSISSNETTSERLNGYAIGRRTNNASEHLNDEDGEDVVDGDVEARVLLIDFNQKSYRELEELEFDGKSQEIWRVVKKHLSNERLCRYIYAYRQAQNKLSAAFLAIDDDNLRKARHLIDEELVQTRDSRGLSVLHYAVLRERHEITEYIANAYPKYLDIQDRLGRTSAHYAALQQNAVYDTLVEAGANVFQTDKNGFTASRYRDSADVLPHVVQPYTELLNKSPANVDRDNGIADMQLRNENKNVGYQSMDIIQPFQQQQRMSIEDADSYDPDAPDDDEIERWLLTGDVDKLEQLVLEGRAHLLADKTSMNLASSEFLDCIAQCQAKIEAIHKAVEDGDVRRVRSLIDRPALSTARDRNGMTPLHKAMLYGQTNTVRYLLTKYPECVNCADHAGRTALHYAAADPNGEHMIKVLQKSGGDAFIEDKYGHTPFYYRTHGKRINERNLKDNAIINQLISGQLNRPLLQDLEEDITDWIHTGNVGKLEELVLNGYADLLLGRTHQVDDTDASSFLDVLPQYQAKIQAIHKAIEQGNLRAVKLLTDRKKLALCRDGRGLTPLHKAIVFSRTDIAKYIIRNYPQTVNAMDQNKRTPLHYAAALRDGGYLYKMMRKAGADPNIFDCNGRPAKYYLKYPGEINLERMRLDTKQALKQVLHNRVAPSYLETNVQQWLREGNLNKLDQLILSGCGDLLIGKKSNNPDTTIFIDEVPHLLITIDNVHKAIREGDLESVKSLVKSKRLALARDRYGCTPLHTAIIHEQSEIIRFIASHFPSVLNAPDYNKRTPMHYAAAARDGGHYLKILGKAGADSMAVDNEGRTPDYYRRNAVFDLKLLKERDDDISVEIFQEKTFDDVAAESGDSADTASNCSSTVQSGQKYMKTVNNENRKTVLENKRGDIEFSDESDKTRFEKLLQDKLDIPSSDNGLYLARTVAPVLTKALAEVLLRRPTNPIGFISEWLTHYNDEI